MNGKQLNLQIITEKMVYLCAVAHWNKKLLSETHQSSATGSLHKNCFLSVKII